VPSFFFSFVVRILKFDLDAWQKNLHNMYRIVMMHLDETISGGAGKNNNNGNANENVDAILKNVKSAQNIAKGTRGSIRRGDGSGSLLGSIDGKNPGGARGWLDGARSFFSPSGEPMTRFTRNRTPNTGRFTPGSNRSTPSGRSAFMNGAMGSRSTRVGARGEGDRDGVPEGTAGKLRNIFGIDSITRVMYVLKFMRIFVVAGALYLASKTFQTRYVTAVFVNNEPPPGLMGFVLTFVVIEAIFMSLILFIVMLLAKTLDMNEMFPITDQVFSLFLFDSIVSSILTAVLGLMISMVVMKKKYFRYRTDGMRAIRSLQEMMLNVAIVTSLLPYYIIERA
jgi:hypothetical protein